MRITCLSMADFTAHLTHYGPSKVFGKVVYVDVNRMPMDEAARNAIRFAVVIQASAIIAVDGQGGQCLLVAGEKCGIDYMDASKEHKGSDRAETLLHNLEEFCQPHGIKVMPGAVSE